MKSLFAAAALATTVAAPVSAALVDVTISSFSSTSFALTFFGIDDALTNVQTATAIFIGLPGAGWTVDLGGVPAGTPSAHFVFNADGSFASRIDLSYIDPPSYQRLNYDYTLSKAIVECETVSSVAFNCVGQIDYSISSPTSYYSSVFEFSEVQSSGFSFRTSPSTTAPISPVPLPAGGLLLLSAVGGAAALKRRKTRAAA